MFQLLDWVELCYKSRRFFIFTGCPLVSEGVRDLNNLFNLANVLVAMFNVVVDSCDGGHNCSVGGGIASEGDGCLHPAKWCANGGIRT